MEEKLIGFQREKEKKKFCVGTFILSLITLLIQTFLFELEFPVYIFLAVTLFLTVKMRNTYKMWPNLIIIIPVFLLMLFFSITIRITPGYIIP